MTRYSKDKNSTLKAISECVDDAQRAIKDARKAAANAGGWRLLNLKEPKSISEDLVILEQHIQSQINALEIEIILYRRLVQDIQEEMTGEKQ